MAKKGRGVPIILVGTVTQFELRIPRPILNCVYGLILMFDVNYAQSIASFGRNFALLTKLN